MVLAAKTFLLVSNVGTLAGDGVVLFRDGGYNETMATPATAIAVARTMSQPMRMRYLAAMMGMVISGLAAASVLTSPALARLSAEM